MLNSTIIDLLEDIEDDTLSYLNRNSVTELYFFLDGYTLNAVELNGQRSNLNRILGIELNKMYNTPVNYPWWETLCLVFEGDEKKAFDSFYQHFHSLIKNKTLRADLVNIKSKGFSIFPDTSSSYDRFWIAINKIAKRPAIFLGNVNFTRFLYFMTGFSKSDKNLEEIWNSLLSEVRSEILDELKFNINADWSKLLIYDLRGENYALHHFFKVVRKLNYPLIDWST